MSELAGDWDKIGSILNYDKLKAKIRQSAARVGNYGANQVKKGIINGKFAPLHPATIARKHSSKPLIDHGDLIGSITYKVLDDNSSVFIGVKRGKEANIAAVHEFGCTIGVTPKMRAYLHYIGIHLKATTQYIHIPARPYLRPVLRSQDFLNEVKNIYTRALKEAFEL